MEEQIRKEVMKVFNQEADVNDVVYNILAIFEDNNRLFKIDYHNSYAIWDDKETTIKAKDKNEALSKFWHGKNPESWEVTSVVLLKD
jgi:hypothetical protein